VSLLCVVFPFSATALTGVNVVLTVLTLTISVGLWTSRRRLAHGVVHAVITFAITVVSGCVAPASAGSPGPWTSWSDGCAGQRTTTS
jgi:hypothetical protein